MKVKYRTSCTSDGPYPTLPYLLHSFDLYRTRPLLCILHYIVLYRIRLYVLHYVGLYRAGQLTHFLYYIVLYRISVNSAVYCPIPHFCAFCIIFSYTAFFYTFCIILPYTAFFCRFCVISAHTAQDNVWTFCIILSYVAFLYILRYVGLYRT